MNAFTGMLLKDHSLISESSPQAAAPLTDAACTSVPLKPSAAMLAAGSRAGGVSVEVAWKIYLAMIRSDAA